MAKAPDPIVSEIHCEACGWLNVLQERDDNGVEEHCLFCGAYFPTTESEVVLAGETSDVGGV